MLTGPGRSGSCCRGDRAAPHGRSTPPPWTAGTAWRQSRGGRPGLDGRESILNGPCDPPPPRWESHPGWALLGASWPFDMWRRASNRRPGRRRSGPVQATASLSVLPFWHQGWVSPGLPPRLTPSNSVHPHLTHSPTKPHPSYSTYLPDSAVTPGPTD